MKVFKEKTDKGREQICIVLSAEDADLLQSAALQFAEKIAIGKAHQTKFRRLAMLIDKKI